MRFRFFGGNHRYQKVETNEQTDVGNWDSVG
jgi:hypothetical protein